MELTGGDLIQLQRWDLWEAIMFCYLAAVSACDGIMNVEHGGASGMSKLPVPPLVLHITLLLHLPPQIWEQHSHPVFNYKCPKPQVRVGLLPSAN